MFINQGESTEKNTKARIGVLTTPHGEINTPVFMPVATRAAMKGSVGFDELERLGAQISLGNTYHLHLKPGSKLIQQMGGLHHWERWNKPILTDSGGFQVFSIIGKKITQDGVWFNSHINGDLFYLDAETSIQIQIELGSDILMAFDECPPNIPDFKSINNAVNKTTAWAKRSINHFEKFYNLKTPTTERPQLFGIIQGGSFKELRKKSLKEITSLPFDGFAMGGLAVGETNEEMYKVLGEIVEFMPENKARYLMGVGTPENLLEAINKGVDMFDCVLPARNARHGSIFTKNGTIKIKNAKFKYDQNVLDDKCQCEVCAEKKCSRSYIHHLLKVGEPLGKKYTTIHNLFFYQELMKNARNAIQENRFNNFKNKFLQNYSQLPL
jgi:queuine tRNA-ribosyltransferase